MSLEGWTRLQSGAGLLLGSTETLSSSFSRARPPAPTESGPGPRLGPDSQPFGSPPGFANPGSFMQGVLQEGTVASASL